MRLPIDLRSIAKKGVELKDLILKTNSVNMKLNPIYLKDMKGSDFESFFRNIEDKLFTSNSKESFQILNHSTTLKPNKKEG